MRLRMRDLEYGSADKPVTPRLEQPIIIDRTLEVPSPSRLQSFGLTLAQPEEFWFNIRAHIRTAVADYLVDRNASC